mmetsp:Transcript_20693/g.26714  ORF Transcript_20693/g.26714 Transcript_20693/m.26714 type:complete len:150 (+) Transcript_20693:228-677(+)|eukprot:CAMPEP_0198146228 /NCGR_PEP_ID=MMETSP1443-20131203/28238_1 /TAXON_ID=186043 /ORGANISM="Entomoneis sp., Strain CCMP2396" /LENGTH=149 /DNA_ID=CAMNT_0043810115 /DNA_START=108 /DNA_END=557 /DNA_ORIENTATION=+
MTSRNSTSLRIDSDGNVVDPSAAASDGLDSSYGSSSRIRSSFALFGAGSGGTIDTFGFNLDYKQFAILIILATIIMGVQACSVFIFFLALFVYHGYQRFTEQAASRSSNSYLGGGGSGGGGSGSGGTSRGWGKGGIRGISDLPCDPVRG